MKFRFLYLTVLFMFFSFQGFAQPYTISGYVEEKGSGERLIGAHVYELNSENGAITNDYGYFSLKVPQKDAILRVSFVGYAPAFDTLTLDGDYQVTYKLDTSVSMKAVEVRGEKDIQKESQMSKVDVPVKEVEKLPKLFGEADVMRTAQLMPGVQSGNEASSGLFVRGGSPDQNLILLDGVPLYNASHLGGLFSVFNNDAIKSMEIIKGGFPARYGDRLSSVVDIRMKDGNMKEFHGKGSIGLLSSKLTLEGPIVEDTTSFMISARRSYLDLLMRPISRASMDGNGSFAYHFYDVNAKVNHKFSDKDRLYLSFYSGDDRINVSNDYDDGKLENLNAWGNLLASLRWNHVFSDELFANFTANFTRYRFKIDISQEGDNTNIFQGYKSNVQDWFLKGDFDYYPAQNHEIKFGIKGMHHTFTPGVTTYQAETGATDIDTTFGSDQYQNYQFNAYVEDNWDITPNLKANLGLHGSAFTVDDGAYYSLQPRLSARYLLDEESSVKASFATMRQFVHLLTNSDAGLPTDLWVPSTDQVPPQESRQVAAGYSRTLFDGDFELNVEAYYKTMDNLISYSEGANFFASSSNWEQKIETGGEGKAYGAELRFQKKRGKTTGWIGYTLSKSTRQFENVNFGEPYPYRYDRRHDISLAITHDLTENIDISGTWVYGTGDAVTLPFGHYRSDMNGRQVRIYKERNGYRMKPYHRLDLSANFKKDIGWAERTWNVSIYNAYNRQNPYFYFFEHDSYGSKDLKQFSLFPILPSVSYSLKF